MKLFHDLADIFYPTTCPGCGKVVERDRGWCEDCLKRVWNPRLLNSSHTDHLHGCYTLCNYEGAVRKIIIQLKYGGRIDRKKGLPAPPFPISLLGKAYLLQPGHSGAPVSKEMGQPGI